MFLPEGLGQSGFLPFSNLRTRAPKHTHTHTAPVCLNPSLCLSSFASLVPFFFHFLSYWICLDNVWSPMS
jgi:hypothetical protein